MVHGSSQDNHRWILQLLPNMFTPAPFAVKSLDHVVLTVKDYQATIDFYTKWLGMTHEKFSSKGDERYACLQVSH